MSMRELLSGWTVASLGLAVVMAGCSSTPDPPPRILDADPAPTEDGRAPGAGQADLDRGVAYIEKEAWAEARPHLQQALEAQPDNAEAHYYLALVQSRIGETDAAETGFEKAVELDPKLTLARVHLGQIYLSAEPFRAKEAIAVLGPAAEAEPDAADIHALLGFAHRVQKSYDASAKHYKVSLSAKDDDQVRFAYADMLFEAKRFDESAAQMRKLLPKVEDDKAVLAQLAHRFAKAKAFDDCVDAFTKAITLDAKEPGFYLHRGLCKHSLKNEPAARADYEKALGIDQRFQPAWYYMGMSWLDDDKRTKALQALDRAYKIDESSKVGKAAKAKMDELRGRR